MLAAPKFTVNNGVVVKTRTLTRSSPFLKRLSHHCGFTSGSSTPISVSSAYPRRNYSGSSHYMKNSNRSCRICNRPLMPVTSTHSVTVVVWRPLPISAPGRPRGWPLQHPLPMWTSGNGLLKHLLHKFFVTNVKESPLHTLNVSVTGL
jgi:hypothetical protein